MNGTINRKSRYSTMRAAIHKPTPNEAANARRTKTGAKIMFGGGTNSYQIINTTINAAEIRKSTKLVITLAAGMTRRGKYTFEIRFAFVTRLLPLSESAVEKNCHGSIPQKTRSGYLTPPDGILPSLPKTSVRTTIVRMGRISDQATPTTVCLYRTRMSRQARK